MLTDQFEDYETENNGKPLCFSCAFARVTLKIDGKFIRTSKEKSRIRCSKQRWKKNEDRSLDNFLQGKAIKKILQTSCPYYQEENPISACEITLCWKEDMTEEECLEGLLNLRDIIISKK